MTMIRLDMGTGFSCKLTEEFLNAYSSCCRGFSPDVCRFARLATTSCLNVSSASPGRSTLSPQVSACPWCSLRRGVVACCMLAVAMREPVSQALLYILMGLLNVVGFVNLARMMRGPGVSTVSRSRSDANS